MCVSDIDTVSTVHDCWVVLICHIVDDDRVPDIIIYSSHIQRKWSAITNFYIMKILAIICFSQGPLNKPNNFQHLTNMTHVILTWDEPPSRIKDNITYSLDLRGSYTASLHIIERIYSFLRPPGEVIATITPYNSVGAGENSSWHLNFSCKNGMYTNSTKRPVLCWTLLFCHVIIDEINIEPHIFKEDDAILARVQLTLKVWLRYS